VEAPLNVALIDSDHLNGLVNAVFIVQGLALGYSQMMRVVSISIISGGDDA